MSGWTLFTNSTDGLSFEPEYGFKEDDRKIQNENRTRAGRLYQYKFGDYRRWRLPLRYVNSADKATLNDWWRENQALYFYDNNDTSAAATYSVKLINRSVPIDTVEKPYDYEWRGVIELEEF